VALFSERRPSSFPVAGYITMAINPDPSGGGDPNGLGDTQGAREALDEGRSLLRQRGAAATARERAALEEAQRLIDASPTDSSPRTR
jgi:hypothetical protein